MDLKQIAAGGAPDEVAEPFQTLNKAFGRLLWEEATAQEPGLGLDEDETVLVFAEASSNLRVRTIYQHSPTWREDANQSFSRP